MDGRSSDRMAHAAGLNFTAQMRRLCQQIAIGLPPLAHIDLDRVAIRGCRTRHRGPYGLQASLTPLRFAGGQISIRRRGRTWELDRLLDSAGREILYLLSFYLPRFLDRPLVAKLETVVHELWHIGPAFDGDLRRHPGRCYAHSSSQKQYDAHVAELTRVWLAANPPAESYAFLSGTFAELVRRHGQIVAESIRAPRMHVVR